jgi:hypothetical protein
LRSNRTGSGASRRFELPGGWVTAAWLGAVLVWGVVGHAAWASYHDGPWTAQIVDAETGQPLEGVIVVAFWVKLTPGPIHPGETFYDAIEVVSDVHGRVTVPPLRRRSPDALSPIKGPEFCMFKGGYGEWRFQGADQWLLRDAFVRDELNKQAWERFRGAGVIIELPRLTTREERRRMLARVPTPSRVPPELVPLLMDAKNQESVAVGLTPYGYPRRDKR